MDALHIQHRICTSQQKTYISFIFDDGCEKDELIYQVFCKYGFTCGFAIIADRNLPLIKNRYLKYQKAGFSILSHSTDGTPMSTNKQTVAEVKDKFVTSHKKLSNAGFKIVGWVTPSSQLNDKYLDSLKMFYSYGYTVYFNDNTPTGNPWNTIEDTPWRLKRRYLGTNINTLKTIVNNTINNNGCLTFYYHTRDLGTDMTLSALEDFLQWLRNHNIEVLPPDLVVSEYYGL